MIHEDLESVAARAHAEIAREPHLHVKRTLAAQALDCLELLDAPAAEVAVHRERHAIELPDHRLTLEGDGGIPARDPFVELGYGAPGPHHDLNQAMIVAEVASTTAAEVDIPTRLDLARLAHEKLMQTAELEATLKEAGRQWGDEPVDTSAYAQLMALPVADRVEQLLRERGGSDEDPAG